MYKKNIMKVYACSPSTVELKQEDCCKSEASLGYLEEFKGTMVCSYPRVQEKGCFLGLGYSSGVFRMRGNWFSCIAVGV